MEKMSRFQKQKKLIKFQEKYRRMELKFWQNLLMSYTTFP